MSFVLTNRILDDSVSLARTFYVDQLKRVLRGMRLPIQGNKSNLRERLFNHISALRIQLNIPASKITAQASLELFCQLVSPDLITPVINHAARPPVINNMPTPQVFNPIPVVPVISFDINKISFQKSPFYEFVATLSPLKLMDSTVFKNAFRMDFILSQERINQIIKKEISIVLLAATISVKNGNLPVMPTGPVKIMYPGCQLFVNGSLVAARVIFLII